VSRGGKDVTTHSQGHLRGMFMGYLFYYHSYSGREKPDLLGMTIEQVIGKLWNCTDILPAEGCSLLGIPQGSTYAIAVRKFKEQLGAAK
jgi:hypothetical protein